SGPTRSPRSLHPQPTVDDQPVPRYEGGLVGAEEAYRAGDVRRLAEPPERRVAEHRRGRLLRQDVGELRAYVAWRDDVRAHPAAAELARERLREPDDPGLGGRVVRLAPVAVDADDGGDVDDRAGPLLHHRPAHGAAGIEDGREVRLDHRSPIVVGHARQETVAGEAG